MKYIIRATKCISFVICIFTFATQAMDNDSSEQGIFSLEELSNETSHIIPPTLFETQVLQIAEKFRSLPVPERLALDADEHCDFTRFVAQIHYLTVRYRHVEKCTEVSDQIKEKINDMAREIFNNTHKNEPHPLTPWEMLHLEQLAHDGKFPLLRSTVIRAKDKLHVPLSIKQMIASSLESHLQEYVSTSIELSGRLRNDAAFVSQESMNRICTYIRHPSERVQVLIAQALVPTNHHDRALIVQEALQACRNNIPSTCQLVRDIRECLKIERVLEFNLQSLELLFQDIDRACQLCQSDTEEDEVEA